MSIINDALKKTQAKLSRKDQKSDKEPDKQENKNSQNITNVYEKLYKTREANRNEANPQKTQEGKKSAPPLRPAKKWFKTFFVIIIFLAFISGGFFFITRYQPAQDFFRSITKNKVPASRAHIVTTRTKKRKYKSGELVLNGTSLIDGKRVALINDEIYEIGDAVNGKEITSINLNRVELRDDEKIITLKVH